MFRQVAATTLLVVVMTCAAILPEVEAQEATGLATGRLTVATRVLPPFVVRDGATYTGFSVDLWNAIAAELHQNFQWKEVANVKEILDTVAHGDSDLAISAISITSQREEGFDFSQSMFESGLQILVPAEGGSGGLALADIWRIGTTGPMLVLWTALAALILIPAHIVWWSESRAENGLITTSYWRGILHAIWWSTCAAAGQQLEIPRSVAARFLSWLAIPVSVIFVAYFTAAVTAAFTVAQLQGNIAGPADLPGKRVGTTTGSTSAAYLRDREIEPVEFQSFDDAAAALEHHKLDAIVFDAPVMLYYASHDGRGRVEVVGPIFKKEDYGILFPQGSDLRKPVSAALLKLRENGTYDQIFNRWFRTAADRH